MCAFCQSTEEKRTFHQCVEEHSLLSQRIKKGNYVKQPSNF